MSATETRLLQGRSYNNFINAIKSPATQLVYRNSLRRYLNYLKITDIDTLLLHASNPKFLESQIIDYIMTLRNEGLAYATIQSVVAPILTYYSLNDVVLNKRKVSRYYGEYKRVVKDRAYTVEEIHRALQTADQRMKVIILLMASTGERIGYQLLNGECQAIIEEPGEKTPPPGNELLPPDEVDGESETGEQEQEESSEQPQPQFG